MSQSLVLFLHVLNYFLDTNLHLFQDCGLKACRVTGNCRICFCQHVCFTWLVTKGCQSLVQRKVSNSLLVYPTPFPMGHQLQDNLRKTCFPLLIPTPSQSSWVCVYVCVHVCMPIHKCYRCFATKGQQVRMPPSHINYRGAGQMPQSINFLSYKLEDLTFSPWHSHEKLGVTTCSCNSSIGEVETGIPGALWPINLAESASSSFSESPCLKKN